MVAKGSSKSAAFSAFVQQYMAAGSSVQAVDGGGSQGGSGLSAESRKHFLMFGVSLAVIGALYYGLKNKDEIRSLFDRDTTDRQRRISREGVSIRNCLATENYCSNEGGTTSNCLSANGNVQGPAAVTADGLGVCCTFSCEVYGIPRRSCQSNERICAPGQACIMGDTVMQVNAVDEQGNGCCTFDCYAGDGLAQRACSSSEVLCAEDSLCYTYSGEVTQPKAANGLGVCCQYNGAGREVCAPP